MTRAALRLLLAVLVVASATAALALGERGGRQSKAVFPAPAAPVLSARRAPALLREVAGGAALGRALGGILADPSLGSARNESCLSVRRAGIDLVRVRADTELIPASNLKLLTGIAALHALDPESRFTTTVAAAGVPDGGVVRGPLYLIGGGDPLLATADYVASLRNQPQLFSPLEELADRVVAAGVRTVTGGVVGDESRYDSDRAVDSWRASYRSEGHVGPISALAVNDGFAAFVPRRTGAAAPAAHAAAVFAGLLRSRGVQVTGAPSEGTAGADAVELARLDSPALAEQVAHMLRESDNNSAEMLVKELGVRSGRGGTWESGLAAMRDALNEAGVDTAELHLADGSGLDRSGRASCETIIDALGDAGADSAVSAGLAVAGRTGTLAPPRFVRNPAAGRLRAKTGSLSGVAALSGFLSEMPDGGPPLAFSLLANGLPNDATGPALWERVGAALAAYPDAPPVEVLGPVNGPGSREAPP